MIEQELLEKTCAEKRRMLFPTGLNPQIYCSETACSILEELERLEQQIELQLIIIEPPAVKVKRPKSIDAERLAQTIRSIISTSPRLGRRTAHRRPCRP